MGVTRTPGGLIIDMDGVLYIGDRPRPGLGEFFDVASERPFVLVTNNSLVTAEACAAKLAAMGVTVPAASILTVSDATGRHLSREYPAGTLVQVLGSAALRSAIASAGMKLVPADGEVVVAGLDSSLDYASLAAAVRAVRAGAGFVATSLDPVLLTEVGVLPGAGAIVAAIGACTGAEPVCVGKPSPAMFLAAAGLAGVPVERLLVIGDSPGSDIAGGAGAGAMTALVPSPLTGDPARSRAAPDLVFSGLAELSGFLASAWGELR